MFCLFNMLRNLTKWSSLSYIGYEFFLKKNIEPKYVYLATFYYLIIFFSPKKIRRELKFSSEFFFCLNLLWVLQWDTVTGMQMKKVFGCYCIKEQIEPFRFQSLVCTIWRLEPFRFQSLVCTIWKFLCGLM